MSSQKLTTLKPMQRPIKPAWIIDWSSNKLVLYKGKQSGPRDTELVCEGGEEGGPFPPIFTFAKETADKKSSKKYFVPFKEGE